MNKLAVIALNKLLLSGYKIREGFTSKSHSPYSLSALMSAIKSYEDWYNTCKVHQHVDNDLLTRFRAIHDDDINPVIATLKEQPQTDHVVQMTNKWLSLQLPIESMVRLLEDARRRVFKPTSILEEERRNQIAELFKGRSIYFVNEIFTRSGWETGWWAPPLRPHPSSQAISRARGWLDGLLVHAPEREAPLLKALFTTMAEDPRWRQKPEVLDQLQMLKTELVPTQPAEPGPVMSLANLHPRISEAAATLFANCHYDQAVLEAAKALINDTKIKAQRPELDGVPLMLSVFSEKKPVLQVQRGGLQQLGVMHLMAGMVSALRNPRAHDIIHGPDALSPQEALEWLYFISALFRILDQTVIADN